jgi:hypothetical protein
LLSLHFIFLSPFFEFGQEIQNGHWDTDADSKARDLAEMQEACLEEVKHQGELKLWHPEPLACGRLLHIMTIH